MKVKKESLGRLKRKEAITAYIFIAPMFLGLLVFSIGPFFQNILYSFRKMGTFGNGTFVGLSNYQKLLQDDTFWLALRNTFFYAIVGVPLVVFFSIFFANLVNKNIRGRTLYRTLLYIPAITMPAAISILWRWILNYQYGILNYLLEKIGLQRISWLGDVHYVRWAIILVLVWSMVSYYTIIMLAAMQGIDKSYYEAAKIDGATNRQLFFKITLPLLGPMIFFTMIMVTIGILQIFDFIYLMVDRTTYSYTYSMSLVTYFYECAFNKSSMRGYGAAISVVLALIIMVITIIQMIVKKYWMKTGD
ncbi:MAG: sugar ABC transporter permease [Oscillospiraceae bacterium]|nr:sugar ABC transporter permease [Clostridiales bacterium]MCI7573538.1 sugar ABC transporter permease [Clostridiales bacterium]MDD7674092.1 sugar ABC transporter permease [Oscillospiraceae bacterium]MDY5641872.1 sugar ABC transporter permease [Candidatus Faecousia sp.]